MKKSALFLSILITALVSYNQIFAQKLAFISSETVKQYMPEAKQAEQRINTIVDEWKRELETLEKNTDILESEIKKNRLVWSDEEKTEKERELENIKRERLTFARLKFETNGEYDKMVTEIMKPIEEKIYAASQEVAVEEGFDIIFDKTVQPLPYSNYKYDMTVKVLKKLGVNVDELEKEQQEKIAKDPRNQKNASVEPPGRRSKARDGSSPGQPQTREVEKPLNYIPSPEGGPAFLTPPPPQDSTKGTKPK